MISRKVNFKKVVASEHAQSMKRSIGVDSALRVAIGSYKTLTESTPSKVLSEREIERAKAFWVEVIGVLKKV